MTGYLNNDGSALVGGQKPSGQGQALQVDTAGNLLVNVAAGGGGSGSVVNIADPTTPANKLAVDGSGKIGLNNFPTSINIADPTTPANKIAVDASGRVGLNNFPALQAVNLTQVNSVAHSLSNPVFTEDQIRAWIINGQSYSATTSKQTAAGAINAGFSLFNPAASGKVVLLYSLKFMIGNTSFNTLTLTTTDPAFGSSLTITNNRAGAAGSSVVSATFTNTNMTTTGTTNDTVGGATNVLTQVFFNGDLLVLPAGNGAAFYLNISGANSWAVSADWVEM